MSLRRGFLFFAVAGALVGGVFTALAYDGPVQGLFVGALIGAGGRGVLALSGRRAHAWPFAALVLARGLGFMVVIVGALTLGVLVFGTSENRSLFDLQSLGAYWSPESGWAGDVVFSLVVSLIFTLSVSFEALIGPSVFWAFILGRYHRPRREERVFLFLDLEGSSGIAERVGDLEFHRLISRVVADVSPVITAHGGQIDRYVGDAVVATWRAERPAGVRRALECVPAIFRAVAARGETYRDDFGLIPRFRAGLHAGSMVAGEIGVQRREILFLGDTVNVTSRVEEACRTYGRRILVTGQVLARAGEVPGLAFEPLGPFRPRGTSESVELYALEGDAVSPPAPRPA